MAKEDGLFRKYNIQKADGSPVDPNAVYFVLRLDNGCSDKKHLHACREAALVYADQIENHLPKLAQDLRIMSSIKRWGESAAESIRSVAEKLERASRLDFPPAKIFEPENFVHDKYGYCYYAVEKETAFIYNLYVYPEYRRLGHARRLLNEVIVKIKKLGHDGEICIEAQPREGSISREDLKRFYQSLGLMIFKREEDIEKKIRESEQLKNDLFVQSIEKDKVIFRLQRRLWYKTKENRRLIRIIKRLMREKEATNG